MAEPQRWSRHEEAVDGTPAQDDIVRADDGQLAEEKHQLASRARFLVAVFVVISLVVVARLASWQLASDGDVEGQPAAAQAETSERGRIIDRNGLLLATDDYLAEIYASPARIRAATADPALVPNLVNILGLSTEEIDAALSEDSSTVILKKVASSQECEAIKALRVQSLVWCDHVLTRAYPQGPLAAHIIGFSNYRLEGVYGVEASYDEWLRSTGKWLSGKLPGKSQPMPEDWKLYLPSPSGHDLVLNLDAPLQHVVEARLAETMAYYGAESGSVILMDPRTGGILAQANQPTFDLNDYSAVTDDTWINSSVSTIYEPGSVFKLVTLAAALDSNLVTPDTYYDDPGVLMIGEEPIRNAELKSYGTLTVRDALAHSVNVVTAQISMDMGSETFYRYVRQFGFGKLTEIDMLFESLGIVQQPGNDLWSYYVLATNSFGQGISVTSIQMANAVAAIANDGVMLQPQVVAGIIQDGQLYRVEPRVLGYPIRPETAQQLRDMMVYTVQQSSHPDMVPGYTVAGKTGTAEIPTETGYRLQESITSFVGFLPADDPQLLMLVTIVKPQDVTWAEQVAMPLFGDIAKDAVRILEIPPDHPIE